MGIFRRHHRIYIHIKVNTKFQSIRPAAKKVAFDGSPCVEVYKALKPSYTYFINRQIFSRKYARNGHNKSFAGMRCALQSARRCEGVPEITFFYLGHFSCSFHLFSFINYIFIDL